MVARWFGCSTRITRALTLHSPSRLIASATSTDTDNCVAELQGDRAHDNWRAVRRLLMRALSAFHNGTTTAARLHPHRYTNGTFVVPGKGNTMNKLVKGSIAAAVGVAVLMGGAGTFAYWNSSVGLTNQTVSAGNLAVSDATPADGVWTVQKNGTGTATTVASITAFRASPGDKLTYTKSVQITASGDTLSANLALGAGSITPATSTNAADTALSTYLQKTATIAAAGTGITTANGVTTVTPGTAGIAARTVVVTVVLDFPKSATAGAENATKTGAVNLAGLTVDLNQI
jgi:alternate signal-mediated exported protein